MEANIELTFGKFALGVFVFTDVVVFIIMRLTKIAVASVVFKNISGSSDVPENHDLTLEDLMSLLDLPNQVDEKTASVPSSSRPVSIRSLNGNLGSTSAGGATVGGGGGGGGSKDTKTSRIFPERRESLKASKSSGVFTGDEKTSGDSTMSDKSSGSSDAFAEIKRNMQKKLEGVVGNPNGANKALAGAKKKAVDSRARIPVSAVVDVCRSVELVKTSTNRLTKTTEIKNILMEEGDIVDSSRPVEELSTLALMSSLGTVRKRVLALMESQDFDRAPIGGPIANVLRDIYLTIEAVNFKKSIDLVEYVGTKFEPTFPETVAPAAVVNGPQIMSVDQFVEMIDEFFGFVEGMVSIDEKLVARLNEIKRPRVIVTLDQVSRVLSDDAVILEEVARLDPPLQQGGLDDVFDRVIAIYDKMSDKGSDDRRIEAALREMANPPIHTPLSVLVDGLSHNGEDLFARFKQVDGGLEEGPDIFDTIIHRLTTIQNVELSRSFIYKFRPSITNLVQLVVSKANPIIGERASGKAAAKPVALGGGLAGMLNGAPKLKTGIVTRVAPLRLTDDAPLKSTDDVKDDGSSVEGDGH